MYADQLFTSTLLNWSLVLIAAFAIGMSKAGIKGVDMMNVTLMAIVFGGKTSTGIVLPLLCITDIFAVLYYHRHAQWPQFWKLVPWMGIGVLIGVWVGKDLDEVFFKKMMAIIIILSAIIMVGLEFRKIQKVPTNKSFFIGMGLAAGFTTMIGNLAGAFSNIYFLAMRMSKNNFIGTAAWLFLVINLFKLPFQVFYWHNINAQTLMADVYLLPALFAGFFTGIFVVKKIKDDTFRKVVIVLTLLGALIIFFKT